MRCFLHPERDAVGVCAACLRGLCVGCAPATGRLSCPGKCADEVAAAVARTDLLWERHELAHRVTTVALLLLAAPAVVLAFVADEPPLRLAAISIGALTTLVAILHTRLSIRR